jgi:hypothetical protein
MRCNYSIFQRLPDGRLCRVTVVGRLKRKSSACRSSGDLLQLSAAPTTLEQWRCRTSEVSARAGSPRTGRSNVSFASEDQLLVCSIMYACKNDRVE